VGKNNNIIEINGQRYDATTGVLLSAAAGSAAATAHAPHIVHPTAKATAKPVTARPIPVRHHTPKPIAAQSAKSRPKHRVHDAIKQAAKPGPSHKPQAAKTLMRSAVQKPATGFKRHTKAHGHTDSLVKQPSVQLQPKASVRRVDSKRLQLARQTPKSQAVQRFGKSHGRAPEPPTELTKPVARPHTAPVHRRPAPEPRQHSKPQTTADLLERALQSATSHEETLWETPKRRRKPGKLASISMVAAGLVLLGGFVAYQNIANVKLRVASSRAGFTASLPDYQPAGYHLSHLNYEPGQVALNFHSNSDDRTYAITEKVSGWNSEALRDSFLAASGHSYQTVESGGRTLFLYGQNAATWVSGGIWYQVQSNGTLSDRQLVQLAGSM
jgi:hypothetical protein